MRVGITQSVRAQIEQKGGGRVHLHFVWAVTSTFPCSQTSVHVVLELLESDWDLQHLPPILSPSDSNWITPSASPFSNLWMTDCGIARPPWPCEPIPVINLLLCLSMYPTGSVSLENPDSYKGLHDMHITSDSNLNNVIKMVFARFPHCVRLPFSPFYVCPLEGSL